MICVDLVTFGLYMTELPCIKGLQHLDTASNKPFVRLNHKKILERLSIGYNSVKSKYTYVRLLMLRSPQLTKGRNDSEGDK